MTTITLSPIKHRNASQVKIGFDFNFDVKEYIKKFPEVKWSATHKAFYVPFSKDNVNRLFLYLREQNYYVDYSLLKSNIKKVKPVKHYSNIKNIDLKPEYKALINSFVKWMAQRRYSINTINTYESMVISFF